MAGHHAAAKHFLLAGVAGVVGVVKGFHALANDGGRPS
jgi:hypothetical protein